MDFKNYLKEVWSVCEEHDTVIPSFILISILLIYIKIPLASVLLMLILIYYIAPTKDYVSGKIIGKIFQFILFFIFLNLAMMLILIPTTVLFLGLENLTPEIIYNSLVVKNIAKVSAYILVIFVFTPYRIFDANTNVFKAIKYSVLVVKNNFVLFLLTILFLVFFSYLISMIPIPNIGMITYLIGIILTVSLYRLNVKNKI